MAIFRGTGGQGDSTTDTTVTTVTEKAAEAASSATSAANSATSASNSATSAETSATNAATSESNAATSATNASTSATAAETAKTAAQAAQTAAETAETNAETAEANAVTAKNQAVSAKDNAIVAQTAAETAETNAETAYSNTLAIFGDAQDVQDAVDSASTSETNAALYATSALTSATNAANSATSAGTSETNAASSASSAATSAASANSYATDAQTAQTAAETAQAAAEAAEASINGLYLGSLADDPTLDGNGVAVTTGDLYFNTTAQEVRVYTDGDVWEPVVDLAGDITVNSLTSNNDVVVKGNLEVQGTTITVDSATAQTIDLGDNDRIRLGDSDDLQVYHDGTDSYIANSTGTLKLSGNTDVTGNITVSGTVDGRDVAADGTKLDGIEASADVTDTANVTAAGALMDSEVTNLAQVKAFNSADYATAAQGATADSALQTSGGTLTGDLAFGDNVKAKFGASDDLQIYHDGSTSYIKDAGTGNLDISTNGSAIRLVQGNGNRLVTAGYGTAGVKLWYGSDDTEKLATTSTGIDVTGTVTADDEIIVDGASGAQVTIRDTGRNGLQLSQNSTGGGFIDLVDATENLHIRTQSTNNIRIQSSGDISFYDDSGTSEDFYWDASLSRLGLGTANPEAPLEVAYTTSAPSLEESDAGLLLSANNTLRTMFGADPSSPFAHWIQVTNSGGSAAFPLALNPQGGNVGIGTRSPSEVLTVASSTRPRISITDTTNAKSSMDSLLEFDGTDGRGGYLAHISGDLRIYNDLSGQNIQFGTVGTERMRINSSGNVGIGTTSPSYNVEIRDSSNPTVAIIKTGVGGLYLDTNSSASDATMTITASSGLSGQADLAFKTGGNTPSEAMRIDSSGNVGIGTTALTSYNTQADKLVIKNASHSGITIHSGTTHNGTILFADGTTGNEAYRGWVQYQHTLDTLTFGTAGSEAARIDSSGRLGIGTTNPSQALHVKDGAPRVYLEGTSASSLDAEISRVSGTLNGGVVGDIRFLRGSNDAQGKIQLRTYLASGFINSSGLVIDQSGNVGIGTTSPASPLQVDRASTDGSIVTLSKDGTTVGSIGNAFSDNLYISGDSNHAGVAFGTNVIYPSTTTGAAADNEFDLGNSTSRFKNLYLSGGVYLGGTGSANKLDDYEEGTWIPTATVNGFSETISSLSGKYTKVGQSVTVTCKITLSTAGYASSYSQIATLPFTPNENCAGVYSSSALSANGRGNNAVVLSGNTNLWLHEDTGTQTSVVWFATVTYFTAS